MDSAVSKARELGRGILGTGVALVVEEVALVVNASAATNHQFVCAGTKGKPNLRSQVCIGLIGALAETQAGSEEVKQGGAGMRAVAAVPLQFRIDLSAGDSRQVLVGAVGIDAPAQAGDQGQVRS